MDVIERRSFDGLPPNFPEWMAWFRHHGIDPDGVHAKGWVERDTDRYRVTYKALVIEEKLDNGAIRYARNGKDVLLKVRTVQLEAAPSPFPAGGESRPSLTLVT